MLCRCSWYIVMVCIIIMLYNVSEYENEDSVIEGRERLL